MLPQYNNIFYYHDDHTHYPYSIETLFTIMSDTNRIIVDLEELLQNGKNNVIIKKILYKYQNKNIEKKINEIYNDLVIKNIKLAIKNSNELLNLIIKSIKPIMETIFDIEKSFEKSKDIYIKFNTNKYNIMVIATVITDLYFLRRFLDKEYVKNGILYTGSGHMADLVYLLTKYFNYELTNCYHTNKPLKTSQIVKMENNELLNIFNNYDKFLRMQQCVNLFNFSKNFS